MKYWRLCMAMLLTDACGMSAESSPVRVLVNTRPATYTTDWQTAFEGSDRLQIIDVPLLTLHTFEVPDADSRRCLADLMQGRYQLIVVVSRTAAQALIKYLTQQGIVAAKLNQWTATVVAVGQATASELVKWGVNAISPSDSLSDRSSDDLHGEHSSNVALNEKQTTTKFVENNEGMLKLDAVLALTAGDKVLMIKGVGGRRLLYDTLVCRGVQVDSALLYERGVPDDLPRRISQLADTVMDLAQHDPVQLMVLISSQASFAHWCRFEHIIEATIANATRRASIDVVYLCLGGRLTALLDVRAHPGSIKSQVVTIDSLRPASIADAINKISAKPHPSA